MYMNTDVCTFLNLDRSWLCLCYFSKDY